MIILCIGNIDIWDLVFLRCLCPLEKNQTGTFWNRFFCCRRSDRGRIRNNRTPSLNFRKSTTIRIASEIGKSSEKKPDFPGFPFIPWWKPLPRDHCRMDWKRPPRCNENHASSYPKPKTTAPDRFRNPPSSCIFPETELTLISFHLWGCSGIRLRVEVTGSKSWVMIVAT